MREEVSNAVEFLSRIMSSPRTPRHIIENFTQSLSAVLHEHYNNHWFPEKPFKGSGYRCLRIVNNKMDPLFIKAGRNVGLSDYHLLQLLPAEFTMWIDPDEVSYRIGEDGSIGIVYSGASQDSSDSDSLSSQSSDENSHDLYGPCSSQLGNNAFVSSQAQRTFNGINFEYLTTAVVS